MTTSIHRGDPTALRIALCSSTWETVVIGEAGANAAYYPMFGWKMHSAVRKEDYSLDRDLAEEPESLDPLSVLGPSEALESPDGFASPGSAALVSPPLLSG